MKFISRGLPGQCGATLCAPPGDHDDDGDGDDDGDDDDDGGKLVVLVGRPSTILCAPLG